MLTRSDAILQAAGYNAAADVYFSLWQNRPHVELDNDIVPYKRQIDEPRVYTDR